MARVPLYKAAETEMIRRIRAGEWAVGLRLPNEFGLADEFGVSQGTMRRALITLESQGFLSRKPGRGTIVADPGSTAPHTDRTAGVPDFDRLRDAKGDVPVFEVFRARSSTRGTDTAELALFGSGRLAIMERTLKSGGARVALEEIAVPEALVAALPEDGAADFPTLLTDLGLPVASIEDRICAEGTSMGSSVALSVDRHTALLVLTRIARDSAGAVLARQVLQLVTSDIGYAVKLGG
jgi:GntR family transcriptional regulator